MKLYWGLNSIPELQGLSKVHQRQLWRKSLRAALHTPKVLVTYGVIIIMIVIMMIVFANGGLAGVPGGQGVQTVVGGLLGGLVGFIGNQFTIRGIRPFLATRRAAMDAHPRAEDGSYYVPPAF